MEYCIVLRTSNVSGAGTDADVEVRLFGASGETNWLVLDNSGDDREKGDVDIYYVDASDIGDIQRVRVRVREESATPDGPPWHLDRISVRRGQVPDWVKAMLSIPLGNTQYKRQRFESAFRSLPDTKVFNHDDWIYPGKFSKRGTPDEWVKLDLP